MDYFLAAGLLYLKENCVLLLLPLDLTDVLQSVLLLLLLCLALTGLLFLVAVVSALSLGSWWLVS